MSRDHADRVPPHDLEAERSVLGSIMLAPECFDDVARIVGEHSFYADANRRIYAALKDLHASGNQALDVVTLAHALQSRGDLQSVGGPAYLGQVLEAVPHAAHAEYYANIVRQHWSRRNALDVAVKLTRHARDLTVDPLDAIGEASRDLERAGEQTRDFEIPDIADDLLEITDQIDAASHGGAATGLTTGLEELDELTLGVFPGQLAIVAARPGAGKTAFAVSWMCQLAKRGAPALLFSLEMTRHDILRRMLSVRSTVPYSLILSGEVDHSQRYSLDMASNDMASAKILIDDRPSLKVDEIEVAARYWHRKQELAAIFVDHAALISGEGPRYEKMTDIADGMMALAKRINVPVILLCQLNRKIEDRKGGDRRPKMSDLRDSGAFEQNAHHIWMLHREVMYMRPGDDGYDQEKGLAELYVEKNRNGGTGKVNLQFDAPTMQFRNLATGGWYSSAGGNAGNNDGASNDANW